mgnify:CR=1 FL=1
MKNGKILVGITHGDINGVGYEIILKLFSEPMMLELCTPIIYGSPKVATYHRKAMELTTNFVTIQKADEAVASSTFCASRTISGPIPSPGMTAIL